MLYGSKEETMKRISTVIAAVLFLFVTGCAGLIDGVTRDTVPDTRRETTPTEEPAGGDQDDVEEEPSDHLGEASARLVSATHNLARCSSGAGIDYDTRWRSALDMWFFEVERWLRDADSAQFENPGLGTLWTRHRRLQMLLDLDQQILALRTALRRLTVAFHEVPVTPGVVTDSMPEVEQAIERAGRAIVSAENAVDALGEQIGLR
jgi:hypothetical protein